jgi:rhodanese-related sulfurtransferase
VLPGVIGSLQATEAIKLLTGIGTPMIGRMLIYDGLDLSFTTISVAKDPDCPVCSKAPADIELVETVMVCAAPVGRSISGKGLRDWVAANEDILIVDVRNPSEWESGRIAGSLALSRPDLEAALDRGGTPPLPKDRRIVLVCQSGMRSSAAIKALVAAGYDSSRLYNLEQGMNAWEGAVVP